MTEARKLVSLRHVGKRYDVGRAGPLGLGPKRWLHALDDVSFDIHAGEVLGLVGESGSGKSTLGRLIVQLEKPTSGEIVFSGDAAGEAEGDGQVVTAGGLSGGGVQMVFQNPSGSLNPRQRVMDIIAEPIRVHRSDVDVDRRVAELMEQVGLGPEFATRRPHEMSGGQAQRVGIARALALDPRLIICDEPISALDVSIQAQVLNLFSDIQSRTGCSYLFVSHDLPVVERLSHRTAILYLGRIVEIGPTEGLFNRPNHPYTRALIESAPRLEAKKRDFKAVEGEIPSPIDPPSGCHFHPRCRFATDICRSQRPPLREIEPGRLSACHLNE